MEQHKEGWKPSFFAPGDASRIYIERSALIAQEAASIRETHGITPASQDKTKIAAFGIDVQVGFCAPEGSLFVPGAVEDTSRILHWLYQHMGAITTLFFSLDTHQALQIFHPAWWRDAEGHPPAPMTVITSQDIEAGTWQAKCHPEASLAYCQALESTGKYVLTIWPYHTLLGGVSHALMPAVMEASLLHSLLREAPTRFITKGFHPQTENYSVFAPEVRELQGESVGAFDQALFEELMTYDTIYVFGQASSHCVLFTLRDWLAQIQELDPALASKIYILEDAMSPVPAPPLEPLPEALNFPEVAREALSSFGQAGMQVVKTSDPLCGL